MFNPFLIQLPPRKKKIKILDYFNEPNYATLTNQNRRLPVYQCQIRESKLHRDEQTQNNYLMYQYLRFTA